MCATTGIRRTLSILIGTTIALAWTVRAAESPAPKATDSPSARMMVKAMDFRKEAQSESEAAFVRYVGNTDKAKKLFGFLGKTLCPHTDPAKGWVYFFESSIWSLSFPTTTTAVAVFYHPWSDVALVTEWTRQERSDATLTDADLILGDALRNLSKPPYEIEPHWLRSPMPPYLAAGISSARTVLGFEKAFSPTLAPIKDGWRSALPLGSAALMDDNHERVGTLFERNLAGLTRYLEDPAMAPVRNQTRETLEQIRVGNFDQVYKLATETQPQVRAMLKKYGTQWADAKVITCVTKSDDQKKEHCFVLLSLPHLPEMYMTFWFQPTAGSALSTTLTRIDSVDQHQSYKYLGAIDLMNDGPERGDLTRATIASTNGFGRLITIGEGSMHGMTFAAAGGPVGHLLNGGCDELIGTTLWDLMVTPRNATPRPAREQRPNQPPTRTGSAPPRPSQGIPQSGRPQGDGVIPSSAGITPPGVGVGGLPPRAPRVLQGPTQGEHLPRGPVVLPNTGGPPPQGPQGTHSEGRPPGVGVPQPNNGPPPHHDPHSGSPPAGTGPPTSNGASSCPGGS